MSQKNEAAVAAGKKGGAIRKAKLEAAETGEPVDLPEYGQRVMPDGTVEDGVTGEDGDLQQFVPPPSPEESAVEVAGPSPAPSMSEEIAGLVAHGLTEDEAYLIVGKRRGIAGEETAPAPARTPASGDPAGRTAGEGETLGPDPTLVKEYQKRMKDYVPPKTEETLAVGGVTLPVRFADYVKRLAQFETIRRRRHDKPIDEAEILAIIVRAHWNMNIVDRTLLMSPHTLGSSGPAAAFNPSQGQFSG